MSQQSDKKEHAEQVKTDKAAAETEAQNTDSLGQHNPAWAMERDNIEKAKKRQEDAEKEAKSKETKEASGKS